VKIFLSFLQGKPGHPIPAYSFWEHYIKKGIEEAGHQWTECPGADWALGLVPQSRNEYKQWKQETWRKTREWLKDNPVDLFLSYLYPEQVDAASIREIQKSGTPCVNFFCDHVRQFTKLPASFKVFDLNWVPEFKALKLYKNAGYPHINLPMPMWVDPQYRVLKNEANSQVTFIGSKDIQRQRLLEELISKNPELPLAIYGRGWTTNNEVAEYIGDGNTTKNRLLSNLNFVKSQGIAALARKFTAKGLDNPLSPVLQALIMGIPSFAEYNALTSESIITIGINRYPSYRFPASKPDTYSRLRDIEAPMLGACYLTEWTEGIDELYDIQNEIAVYRDANELADQIKALTNNPERRQKLKANGQKKALEKHSIPKSIENIKCTLNL